MRESKHWHELKTLFEGLHPTHLQGVFESLNWRVTCAGTVDTRTITLFKEYALRGAHLAGLNPPSVNGWLELVRQSVPNYFKPDTSWAEIPLSDIDKPKHQVTDVAPVKWLTSRRLVFVRATAKGILGGHWPDGRPLRDNFVLRREGDRYQVMSGFEQYWAHVALKTEVATCLVEDHGILEPLSPASAEVCELREVSARTAEVVARLSNVTRTRPSAKPTAVV